MIDVTPLGTILKGKYQITELIKRGGMGAVFKVREICTGKIWALKELLDLDTDVNERENNLKMFQEEARILSTLSHPNIPQVVAYFAEQDRHYLVMEFITGENLEEKLNKALQKNETLPLKQVMEWAGQVCRVLDYLHNHKPTPIIFRDLKPGNIMVTGEGVVKLIDFGIARTYKIG
ncbi:MAG: serine/threonine-protein kinase, partial [Candidatus Eremiobacterota bacterium]